MVEIRLKKKYLIGGKAQRGFKVPSGGGNSVRHRPNYTKATDAQKRVISAGQVKMARVHFGPTCNKHIFMPYSEVESFLEAKGNG